MTRVIHYRNYGVYVHDETGSPHHSAHAHIKDRGRRIASIHLVTLTVFDQIEKVPADLLERIYEEQDLLLSEWERMNS